MKAYASATRPMFPSREGRLPPWLLRGKIAWLALAAVAAMLLLIALPLAGERETSFEGAESIGRFQYLAVGCLVGVLALSLLTLGSSLRVKPLGVCEFSFLAFMTVCAFSSALGVSPIQSLTYLMATTICYCAGFAAWRVLPPQRMAWVFAFCGVVYVLFAAYCLARYGVGVGRYVGRMTPNHFAAIAGVGAMCCQLGGRYVKIVGGALGVALVVWVVARGMFLSLGVFFTVYYFRWIRAVFSKRGGGLAPFLLAVGFGGLLTVVVVLFIMPSAADKIGNYFDLNSVERGVGSGLTGRSEIWNLGWERFIENPFLGQGFRSVKITGIGETTHSSYIDLLREVGALGLVCYGVFVVLSVRQLFRVRAGMDVKSQDVHRWASAVVVALLFLSFFEINLLTFAFPSGAMILFAITSAPTAETQAPRATGFPPGARR